MTEPNAHSESFVEAVAADVAARGLLPCGAGVVAAVSGGADSVALLSVLAELASRSECGWRLTVAHLNHQLRDVADADEQFVADLAKRLGLPFVAGRRDVSAEAARLGQGTEQAGRMLRYEFLAEVARTVGAAFVATGHHADDNVETILYRIVRGTHLRGLAGMPACRVLEPGVTLVRPLLSRTRAEVEAHCRTAGLDFRDDHTNAETTYRRNFIRHELLPLLRERLNTRADEAVLRLAHAADEAEGYMAEVAHDALAEATVEQTSRRVVLALEAVGSRPVPIRAMMLRTAMERLGAPMRDVGADRMDELATLAEPDGAAAVALPGGFAARRDGGEIVIEAGSDASAGPMGEVGLEIPGRTPLPDGRVVECSVGPHDPAALAEHVRANPPGVELLDADQLRGRLLTRARRAGDAFVPLGAPGRQTVGDFLTNAKLPARRRDAVVCVCDELGIVYVAPLRIDDRVKVTPATRRVLRIAVSPPCSANLDLLRRAAYSDRVEADGGRQGPKGHDHQ